jgi:hypothetical protein
VRRDAVIAGGEDSVHAVMARERTAPRATHRISAYELADLLFEARASFAEQCDRRHDLAGRAEAALEVQAPHVPWSHPFFVPVSLN